MGDWLIGHALALVWLAGGVICVWQHLVTRSEYDGDWGALVEVVRAKKIRPVEGAALALSLRRTIIRQTVFALMAAFVTLIGVQALFLPTPDKGSALTQAQLHQPLLQQIVGFEALTYLEAVQYILLGLTLHDRWVRKKINLLPTVTGPTGGP